MNIDSKDILQKAEELLKENGDCIDIKEGEDVLATKKGSYDIEKQVEEDNTTQEQKQIEKSKQKSRKFYIPKLGYKREIHYKKPKWYNFLAAICVIIILFLIIGALMPYVHPQ